MWAKFSKIPIPPKFIPIVLGMLLIPQVLQNLLPEHGDAWTAVENTSNPKSGFVQQPVQPVRNPKLFPSQRLSSQWVCKLAPGTVPEEIAEKLKARYLRPLKGLVGYSIFEIPRSRDSNQVRQLLQSLPGVLWSQQQKLRPRFSRSHPEPLAITDPLFSEQWHLYSEHSNPVNDAPQIDLNLTTLWEKGLYGEGIQIAVVDDGLEYTHPDLSANYDASLSYDFLSSDTDPAPRLTSHFHGTAVAGIIGARDNGKYGLGIVPRATLAGIRLIDGSVSDATEAESLSFQRDVMDIYNNSWGPSDTDIEVYEGPGPLLLEALQTGVQQGRNGLGNLYVWAAGNGGRYDDNSNFDGYANQPWSIAVAGLNQDGTAPSYAEPGANIVIAAPGVDIVTTDLYGSRGDSLYDFTSEFGGTSAATAMVSGVLALMLQSNPQLTWRDAQHILIQTARQNDPRNPSWADNAANLQVHHKYGFGLIDASAAVALADDWVSMPEASTETLSQTINRSLANDPNSTLETIIASTNPNFVEHVQVQLTLKDYNWGQLNLSLISPNGTESVLATPFTRGLGPEVDEPHSNVHSWTYLTVRNWAEPASGNWTLKIRNRTTGHAGIIQSWKLILHTTTDPNHQLPTLQAKDETWSFPNVEASPVSINVLLNESSQDWTLENISNPVHGSASFTADGLIQYQPNEGYAGNDVINYTVRDSPGRKGRARLHIEVDPPPDESTETTISIAGEPLSFALTPTTGQHLISSQITSGSLQIDGKYTLKYTPDPNSFYSAQVVTLHTTDFSNYASQIFSIFHSPTGELARQLNGQSDAIELLPAEVANNLSAPLTLEAWIYPENYGPVNYANIINRGFARIFDKSVLTLFLCNVAPGHEQGEAYYRYRSLVLWLETQDGDIRYLSTPQDSIQLKTWQHVAVTIDAPGNVQMYINGELQTLYEPSFSASTGLIADNSQIPLLSGNSHNQNRGFEGKIDQLRHWNTVRSSSQIAQYRYFPLQGDEPGLHHYWTLDNSTTQNPKSDNHKEPIYEGTSSVIPHIWQLHFFPDAISVAPNWWKSPTLGMFYTGKAPWVWSPNHQYQFLSPGAPNSDPLWFYDPILGWIWTSLSAYPWYWSHHQQSWLWYNTPTTNPRQIYDPRTQIWTMDQELGQ